MGPYKEFNPAIIFIEIPVSSQEREQPMYLCVRCNDFASKINLIQSFFGIGGLSRFCLYCLDSFMSVSDVDYSRNGRRH